MLEELTLSNHGLDQGWTAALSFCSNLKTLREAMMGLLQLGSAV